ncbi:MAG: hypothetical protein AABP62_19425 [Planctomycetota bacterium]
MTLIRGHFLTIGPLALVAVCYAVAAPDPLNLSSTRLTGGSVVHDQVVADPSRQTEACQTLASDLRQRLPDGWNVVVHEPFVLGGDCDAKHLSETYRQTILPTARALGVQYFDHPPMWPVTILLCSSDDSYRECQRRLDERERSEYSGIYSRTEHRVVINVATGDGTLAHELTHALAHADFPLLAEWLDEGLASLHEECEFSSDGLRLIGLDNWRRSPLREACQREQLRSVIDLASERFATSDRAAIDYAHARYFCLFLQQHRLLEPFYRKCRSRAETDPTGVASLCELFATRRPGEIDERFLAWLNESAMRTP